MSDKFEYGTGRRKTATARTRIYAGAGNITVNGRSYEEYFPRKTLQMVVRQPLVLTKMAEKLDVRVNVAGGGVAGQERPVFQRERARAGAFDHPAPPPPIR